MSCLDKLRKLESSVRRCPMFQPISSFLEIQLLKLFSQISHSDCSRASQAQRRLLYLPWRNGQSKKNLVSCSYVAHITPHIHTRFFLSEQTNCQLQVRAYLSSDLFGEGPRRCQCLSSVQTGYPNMADENLKNICIILQKKFSILCTCHLQQSHTVPNFAKSIKLEQ